ncbi:MAG: MATE family efflux transporter [Chitinophagales bacterium]|nr:MATE family efflux transporter [Chitinophagales bacterium]
MQPNPYISYKNIFRIAWPVMLSSLGQNLIYLVDTSFLGRVSEYDLGASAIGGIFYLLLFMIGYAMNTGMQVIVARRKGEGKEHEIGDVVDHELRLILIVALLQFVAMHFFSNQILSLIIKSDIIREKAVSFLEYRSYGILFALINSCFMSFFIGIGDTKVTTRTTGVMVAVNVFFLYCLVFGNLGFPRMEIAGAGLASSIAEGTVTIVFVVFIFVKKFNERFGLFQFKKFNPALVLSMLNLSAPLIFQQLISVGSWWIFFIAIEHLGERALAISNLIRSLYTLYGVPVWALAMSTSSMTSNLMGQGKPDDVIPLIKKIGLFSFGMAVLFGLVMLLFPVQVLLIFTNDIQLIKESIPSLYTIVFALMLFSIAVLSIFAVSGTGATKVSLIIEIVCIVAYLVYVYFTAIQFNLGLPIIWMAEIVYWVVALCGCYYYLTRGNWRDKKV